MERRPKKLLILYATQTGNTLDVAERVGREAEHRGCPVHLISIDQYDALLSSRGHCNFCCFNHWSRDTPDPMKVSLLCMHVSMARLERCFVGPSALKVWFGYQGARR